MVRVSSEITIEKIGLIITDIDKKNSAITTKKEAEFVTKNCNRTY